MPAALPLRPWPLRLLDALLYSSSWLALAAAAQTWVTLRHFGPLADPAQRLVLMVLAATLLVYNLDAALPFKHGQPAGTSARKGWQQRHRLLLAGLKAGLWFNPFIYLFGRALEMTHEFQADADATGPLPDQPAAGPAYAALLARYAAAQLGALPASATLPLTHSFTHSPILTRLAMLKNSLPVRRWKQVLVLPALAAVLVATACERQLVAPATAPAATASSAEAMQLLPPPPPMVVPPNASPVMTAEQQPEYPGGIGQFMLDLNAAIKYPAAAKAEKLQGRLFLGFVVGADGRIYDAELKKELTPSYKLNLPNGSQTNVELQNNPPTPAQAAAARALEAEALRALRSLEKPWTPGRDKGKAVAVSFTVPMQFTLQP